MATIEESASEEKLKEWVAKKMTYPSVLAVVDIIEKHPDHFSSFEDFVKHALEMNLVWWSPNPQDIMKLMARNLITEEQKQFTRQFQSGDFQDQVDPYTGISEATRIVELLKGSEQTIKQIDPTIAADDKEVVKYDGYPLLFRFYSRFLPAKLSLIVLANMISKEKPYVELEEFQNESYEIISELADIIRSKEVSKRNEKVSTGMPLSEKKINNAPTKQARNEAIRKVSSSETKFKNQYAGKLRLDKKSGNEYFEGILFALGLIVPKKVENKTRIYLSKKGIEYLKIDNPVVNSLINEKEIPDSPFTQEGAKYIIQNLVNTKHLSLEYALCDRVISEIKASTSVDELDSMIEDVCINWIKKNLKVARTHKIEEILEEHQKRKKSDAKQTRLQAWRVATMGRLSELGVVSWKIDAHSRSTYSSGPNSDVS